MNEQIKRDFAEVINRHSLENKIDMPDFLMAEMICDYIDHLSHFHKKRDEWFGKSYWDRHKLEEVPTAARKAKLS